LIHSDSFVGVKESFRVNRQNLVAVMGFCGACTVLIDNEPCQVLSVVGGEAAGKILLQSKGLQQMVNFILYKRHLLNMMRCNAGFVLPE